MIHLSRLPNETSYDGTWVGLFKHLYDEGEVTVIVDKQKNCTMEASVSGTAEHWGGTYALTVEGDLFIQSPGVMEVRTC